MREIKFRAWDSKWGKWIEPSCIELEGTGDGWLTRTGENGDEIETVRLRTKEGKCMIIEQFAGFLDEHGKESYEGDIVRSLQTGIVGVVKWARWSAGFTIVNPKMGVLWLDKCEVIGNIHENPELLK